MINGAFAVGIQRLPADGNWHLKEDRGRIALGRLCESDFHYFWKSPAIRGWGFSNLFILNTLELSSWSCTLGTMERNLLTKYAVRVCKSAF
jgi:hypothetical protein